MTAFLVVVLAIECMINFVVCTTMDDVNVICPVCHTTSTQWVIMSTNNFGSSDLDLRPSEMERSTLSMHVQCCPNCGLCQYNLNKNLMDVSNEVLSSFIYSDAFKSEYQSLKQFVTNDYLPETTSKFHRLALLQQYINASNINIAQSYLSASWICDDRLNIVAINDEKYEILKQYMIKYRQLSAEYFRKTLDEDIKHQNKMEYIRYWLRYIDVLRRISLYKKCIINSNELINKISNMSECDVENQECDIINQITIFQRNMCDKQNNKIYTIQDAIQYNDNIQSSLPKHEL